MFAYGAVLTVSRHDRPADIDRHFAGMKAAGFNTVVLWPAVWWWEEAGPAYPFATGRRLLDQAECHGLKVVMELAGQIPCLEYLPDFRMKDEYLARTIDDRPDTSYDLIYGYLNYNHPEVKAIILSHFAASARAFREHPALLGWDVWNETMFRSFDTHTLALFQSWLAGKYPTVEALNASWERSYTDFAQVRFTRWMWASVMPFVDLNQFAKWNIGQILGEWADAVRAEDPSHPLIADNIGSMVLNDWAWGRPQDDLQVAAAVDHLGMSLYPKQSASADAPPRRWMALAAANAATQGRGFWISELQSHHQSMFNAASAVSPHELAWWNWEAIAHGATAVIYWKWTVFGQGIQTMGRGLLDASGRPSPRLALAAGIAATIKEFRHLLEASRELPPRVGILFDALAWDFTKAYTLNYGQAVSSAHYTDTLAGLGDALWENGIGFSLVYPRDLARPEGLPPVLFTLNQLVLDEGSSKGLQAWLERGGQLVTDARLGSVDALGRLSPSLPGGPLRGWLGLDYLDSRAAGSRATGVEGGPDFTPHQEEIQLGPDHPGLQVHAVFGDGLPALTELATGAARVFTLATNPFCAVGKGQAAVASLDGLIAFLDSRLGMRQREATGTLRLQARRSGEGLLVFVFNYHDQPGTLVHREPGLPPGRRSARRLWGNGDAEPAADGSVRYRLDARETGVWLLV